MSLNILREIPPLQQCLAHLKYFLALALLHRFYRARRESLGLLP
jgi:hypothetical protein